MFTRALPFARGETPVSRAMARKSYKPRPSARNGGFEDRPAWIYDFSAFETLEDMEITMSRIGLGSLKLESTVTGCVTCDRDVQTRIKINQIKII